MMKLKLFLCLSIFLLIFAPVYADVHGEGDQCCGQDSCTSGRDNSCASGYTCAAAFNAHFAGICMPDTISSDVQYTLDHSDTQLTGYTEYISSNGQAYFDDITLIDPDNPCGDTLCSGDEDNKCWLQLWGWDNFFCGKEGDVWRCIDYSPDPDMYYYKATDGTKFWFLKRIGGSSESVAQNAFHYMICNFLPWDDGHICWGGGWECSSNSHCENEYCCALGKTCCEYNNDCESQLGTNYQCKKTTDHYCALINEETCSEDLDCLSEHCVHGTCRSSSTYCGDTYCDKPDETCSNCNEDCGDCPAACGDGTCDTDESCSTCSADCTCTSTQCCSPTSSNANSKGCVLNGYSTTTGYICCSGTEYSGDCCVGDCPSGYTCVSHTCVEEGGGLANGETCTLNSECASGNCNYVCCTSGKTCCSSNTHCSTGYECSATLHYCVEEDACGDGFCITEDGENCDNCVEDCYCLSARGECCYTSAPDAHDDGCLDSNKITGDGSICCDVILYSGDCCSDNDCPSGYGCSSHFCVEEEAGELVSSLTFTSDGTKDGGVVTSNDAPHTWTVNIPDNFAKVEVIHYDAANPETIKKYMGWDGYLSVNENLVWEFLSWASDTGGVIYDYALDEQVYESSGAGLWIDATSFFNAGSNIVEFYHFTGGDGIGLKIKVTTGEDGEEVPAGTPCTDDSDCTGGDNCNNGICCMSGAVCCNTVSDCPSSYSKCGPYNYCLLANGQSCEGSNVGCATGWCFGTASSPNKNKICCDYGSSCCYSDSDCGAGYVCNVTAYSCRYVGGHIQTGGSCDYDSQCASGNCVNNVCREEGVEVTTGCGGIDFGKAVDIYNILNKEVTCTSPEDREAFYKIHSTGGCTFNIDVEYLDSDAGVSLAVYNPEIDMINDLASSSNKEEKEISLDSGNTYFIRFYGVKNIYLTDGYKVTFEYDADCAGDSDCGGDTKETAVLLPLEPFNCYGFARDMWYKFITDSDLIMDFKIKGHTYEEPNILDYLEVFDEDGDLVCTSFNSDSNEECIFRAEAYENYYFKLRYYSGGIADLEISFDYETCGDGSCYYIENSYNCCEDCGCITGECIDSVCVEKYCGDGTCDSDETFADCPYDCEPPAETEEKPEPKQCGEGKRFEEVKYLIEWCDIFDKDYLDYYFVAQEAGVYKLGITLPGEEDYELKVLKGQCGIWQKDEYEENEYKSKYIQLKKGEGCWVTVNKKSSGDNGLEFFVYFAGKPTPTDVICGDGHCDKTECRTCPEDCSYLVSPNVYSEDDYLGRRQYLMELKTIRRPDSKCKGDHYCDEDIGENCHTSENDCACGYIPYKKDQWVQGECDLLCPSVDYKGCVITSSGDPAVMCPVTAYFAYLTKEILEKLGLIKDCKTVVEDIKNEKGVSEPEALEYLKGAFINCGKNVYKPFLNAIGAKDYDFFEFMCGNYWDQYQLDNLNAYKQNLLVKCEDKARNGKIKSEEECKKAVNRMSYFLSKSNEAETFVSSAGNLIPRKGINQFSAFWGCVNEIIFGIVKTYVKLNEEGQHDLDLHVVDEFGRHVGVNYETGEYEIQIPNAKTSYDTEGGSEIIYIPADLEFKAYIDARDAEQSTEEYNITIGTILNETVIQSSIKTETITKGAISSHEVKFEEKGITVEEATRVSRIGEGLITLTFDPTVIIIIVVVAVVGLVAFVFLKRFLPKKEIKKKK